MVLMVLFLCGQVVNVGHLGVELCEEGFTVLVRDIRVFKAELVLFQEFGLEGVILGLFLLVG